MSETPAPMQILAPAETAAHATTSHGKLLPLVVGAVGVVFGDIGTSPLYAIKECFNGEHGLALNPRNIFGVLSLMFWAVTTVVLTEIRHIYFARR